LYGVKYSVVAAVTSLVVTPYKGNQIGLYSGSAWEVKTFSEISLSLSGYTADKNYDIWVYNNSGTVTLDSTVWTNGTTRATALTTQDGVYVKTGDTARRYLGTIRITATTGQCEDSLTKRFVWNYYNRTARALRKLASSAWNYTTTSWRQWNATSSYQVETIIGVQEDRISLLIIGRGIATNQAVGVNVTNSVAAGVTQATNESTTFTVTTSSNYIAVPTLGYSYYAMIEYGHASNISQGYDLWGMTGEVFA